MAIERPDIYVHANPELAISDTDFHRGGFRTAVNSLSGLYALSNRIGDERAPGQVKEYSTVVYVRELSDYYVLTDVTNIDNISGWDVLFSASGGTGTTGGSGYTNAINGLSEYNATTVQLGGSLLDNTIINTSGSSLTFSGNTDLVFDIDINRVKIGNNIDNDNGLHIDTTSYQLFNYSGSNGTYISGNNLGSLDISVDSNNISNSILLGSPTHNIVMNTVSGSTISEINIGVSSTTIGSNYNGFEGIKYLNDYSGNYVNRSLVDKEYVDNEILETSNVVNVTTPINNTYNVLRYDDLIPVSGLSDNQIILYQTPVLGQRVTVVDICGNALSDPIVINGNSFLINDDVCSIINTDYGAITFIFNGLFWSAVGFVG